MYKGRKHIPSFCNFMNVFSWSPKLASFYGKIVTANSKAVARGVDFTISHQKIPVIIAGKCIVTGTEIAAGYREIVAESCMQTIMAATDENILNGSIGTIPKVHRPVGGVFNTDFFNSNVFAID